MSFNIESIPYIDQYIGAWAIHGPHGNALLAWSNNINLQVHLEKQRQETDAPLFPDDDEDAISEIRGSVAVVRLHGVLMKQRSSMTGSTSMVEARRALRSITRNETIDTILLHIDSPGGTSAGSGDLADEVARAAQKKTVIAYIEDLGASAAYKVASRATKIVANRADALVGSLGTYSVVYDMSEAFEKDGIKVHVINAGEFKGMLEEGTSVTDEQLAEIRRIVKSANNEFMATVAAGRTGKINDVDALFDGRIHSASEALRLGLIDEISNLDGILTSNNSKKARNQMENTQSQSESIVVKAATLKEIRSACPGCDSDFQLDMIELEATVQEAQTEWVSRQKTRIEQLQAENKDLQEKIESLEKTKAIGLEPIGIDNKAPEFNDVVEEWHAKLRETSQRMQRGKAITYLAKRHPELYAAYREATTVPA